MAIILDIVPDPPIPVKVPRPSKIQDASRKWCPLCKMFVHRSQFTKKSSARDGLFSYCQSCTKAQAKNDDFRRAQRARHIKRKYDLDQEEYDAMLDAQGNVCAICKNPPTTKHAMHVDHDHDTGIVRGILCNGCNTALGQMRESPAILRAAANYLEKHGK